MGHTVRIKKCNISWECYGLSLLFWKNTRCNMKTQAEKPGKQRSTNSVVDINGLKRRMADRPMGEDWHLRTTFSNNRLKRFEATVAFLLKLLRVRFPTNAYKVKTTSTFCVLSLLFFTRWRESQRNTEGWMVEGWEWSVSVWLWWGGIIWC